MCSKCVAVQGAKVMCMHLLVYVTRLHTVLVVPSFSFTLRVRLVINSMDSTASERGRKGVSGTLKRHCEWRTAH